MSIKSNNSGTFSGTSKPTAPKHINEGARAPKQPREPRPPKR